MFWYRMGGVEAPRRGVRFSHDKLVVRVRVIDNAGVGAAPRVVDDESLADFVRMPTYGVARAGVMLFQVPHLNDGQHDAVRALRDRARRALRRRDDVRFAGRVLQDADSGEPVLYTENVFVRFVSDTPASEIERAMAEHGLQEKRRFDVAGSSAFIVSADGAGTDVFSIASQLLERPDVDRAHPELILPLARRTPSTSGGPGGSWHLGPTSADADSFVHAGVRAAWSETRGAGVTIAVVDDGVDLTHAAFGGQRSVTAHDVSPPRDDGAGRAATHGTACAGVALSSIDDAPGVAPEANLIALRIDEGLGSYVEAEAILAAVAHGADVIVCPWGRPNGYGPVPLPDHVDLALAYATEHGRRGRGCVVVWAAGNGNESMDDDGYASDPRVIAVGSANAMGRRSWYSNYGTRLWCLFPSNDRGLPGIAAPAVGGGVDPDFGGTSAAASGVAGVCALVLAVAPQLRSTDVAAVLRSASTPAEVDTTRFDGAGRSDMHGFGIIDAAAAVSLAQAEADTIAQLKDAFVDGYVVEAIVVVLEDGGARSAVVDAIAALLTDLRDARWSIVPVKLRGNAIDLLPVAGSFVAAADAWSLSRSIAQLEKVASAEPTLDRVAMRPPRVSRSITGFCVHDAATDADRLGCDWPLLAVRAREAWALSDGIPGASSRGAGVRVAHPDSGYRYHDRFDLTRVDKLSAYDIYANKRSARDDRDGNHGLATASVLLSGEPGNASVPFVVGVAPEATLVPFRVVASTLGLSWTVPILVDAGMRRVREAIDRAIEAECHVVSMSLGGIGGETSARLAIRDAVEHGIIVLAAAGNVLPFVVAPAAFPEVIAVAACDVNLNPWRSSASGPEVDVTAPGASVWRAYVDDTDPAKRVSAIERSCGTSFAVAITAGAAALWLAHHGRDALIERYGRAGLVPVFRRLLQETAKPAPNLPIGRFGAGVLDAAALLSAPLPSGSATSDSRSVPWMPTSRAASTPHPSRLLLAPGTADAASESELSMLLDTHPDIAVALDRAAEMPRGRQGQERARELALHALRGRLRTVGASREVRRLLS